MEIIVKINEKDYKIVRTKLGFTLGTLFLFKKLTGKNVYEMNDLEDMVYLLYSALKSNNKDFNYTFESFCEYIDINPEIFELFNQLNENETDTNNSNTDEKKI